jgi:hypothetical protein
LPRGAAEPLVQAAAEWHTEPVIRQIYATLARDEARHGGAYLRYMKRALVKFGDEARAAFSKVGVLMASARRTAQALHPTNLHVNLSLFPRDTVQSRLPDPDRLARWLDKQIQFDGVWVNKVVERILHNLGLLLERSLSSVQELNRYARRWPPGWPRAARRRTPPERGTAVGQFFAAARAAAARSVSRLRSAVTRCALGRCPTRAM